MLFIEGFIKIICTCPPLKSLYVSMENELCTEEDWPEGMCAAKNIFQCIVKHQSKLSVLSFHIGEMKPTASLISYLISCMPCCEIKDI